jgi:AmiR/NasT family two-component response regulator
MEMDNERARSKQVVVAVTSDLLARARLEDAAARAGVMLEIARADVLAERLAALRPDLVVLDLDAGRTELLGRVDAALSEGVTPPRIVGFISHVDKDLAAAAAEAGCEVVARGKFWRGLAELLAGEG